MEKENPRTGFSAGAAKSIAADKGNPIKNQPKEQRSSKIDDTALEFHIREYLPEAEGKELEYRVALLRARDWAAGLSGRTESWRANQYACDAHEIAGKFVFRVGESPERLSWAVMLCRRLVSAAMASEALDSEDGSL